MLEEQHIQHIYRNPNIHQLEVLAFYYKILKRYMEITES